MADYLGITNKEWESIHIVPGGEYTPTVHPTPPVSKLPCSTCLLSDTCRRTCERMDAHTDLYPVA